MDYDTDTDTDTDYDTNSDEEFAYDIETSYQIEQRNLLSTEAAFSQALTAHMRIWLNNHRGNLEGWHYEVSLFQHTYQTTPFKLGQ